MGVIQRSVLAAGAVIFSTTIASATTVGYTEGARPLVAGTTAVADNADDSLPGYNLGTLSTSGVDTIDLFGRIETAHDIYWFKATAPFRVDFIFGGYDLAAGGHVSASGFLADPTVGGDPGNTSEFKLRITAPGDTPLGDVIYTTPYIIGPSFIFSATDTGTYRFRIDGGVDSDPGGAAYYDIRISAAATPLPAALPMFATGFGLGMGMLGWCRKRKARAAAA
jgi:hypothetical protein